MFLVNIAYCALVLYEVLRFWDVCNAFESKYVLGTVCCRRHLSSCDSSFNLGMLRSAGQDQGCGTSTHIDDDVTVSHQHFFVIMYTRDIAALIQLNTSLFYGAAFYIGDFCRAAMCRHSIC